MEIVTHEAVLNQICRDMDALDSTYGLLPAEQKASLLRDIEYLFLDNIAKEIRLVFYDNQDRGSVFLEYAYSLGQIRKPGGAMSFLRLDATGELAFDVFVEFTEAFLLLDRAEQELILMNTERDWYTF